MKINIKKIDGIDKSNFVFIKRSNKFYFVSNQSCTAYDSEKLKTKPNGSSTN
jgi:hypothetical protein